jgi:hypothetical protein
MSERLMTMDLKTIFLLLVVLLVGYGIGLLEMRLRRPKKVPPVEDTAQPVQADAGGQPVEKKEDADLLRIALEPSGSLRLLLEGKRLDSPGTVTEEQRGLLIQLLLQLRPWVEGKASIPAVGPLSGAGAAKPPETAPKPAAESKEKAKEPPAPKSIVAQIDELLQKRLEGTPLAGLDIRLQESLKGGVDFRVGSQSYENVEAIPNPEVVAAIRAAIAEWEKSAG